ncbi:ComEA family DNA-binding protein [uncultured Enterovirga sp.]|uniref:ComEA family DNA-binding protein n=1 Tax=uncultured Enterovirga sp. TaxID=2026352 RepID=UPI0035CB4A92
MITASIRGLALATALLTAGLVSAQAPQTSTPASPATRPATTVPAPAAAPATTPAAKLIDLNSATKEELDVLPGIGPVRAEAIIKGRPYKGKDELTRRKILPQNVYDAIKDRIIARQA